MFAAGDLGSAGTAAIAGLASVLVALVLAALSTALYRLVAHPLARVPGPRLAAFSNAWQAYYARNGRMYELGTTLHKKYGPVVRVGPNEVWFDSLEAFRAIYGSGSGYVKSDFYSLPRPTIDWGHYPLRLRSPDTLDLLSERDMQRYRLQRRLIGPVYQMSNLRRHEKALDAVLERVVARLRTLDGAQVDLKEWMHIVVVECLGGVVLSWSPGYLRDKSDGGSGSHSYIGWRRKTVLGLFPLAVLVDTYFKPLGRLLGILLGLTYKSPKHFRPFFPGVHMKVNRRIRAWLGPKPPKGDSRQDLLVDLIHLHKTRPEFTETYLRRLAVTNFGAGHETTCSALTSALAMIGLHADVQSRVAAELSRTPAVAADVSRTLTYDEITTHCPYTVASIKEAQRLHPAIGMSLPRKVPAGPPKPGAMPGARLHGHLIPPGMTVGCNPVSLHRNPKIFGRNADRFDPDRWLLADELARRTMDRCNLTWGGGARTCPGRNLAELILYKAVCALLREFEVEVVAMPSGQQICYYFMAMLTGVKVRFRERAGGRSEKMSMATEADSAT